MTTLAAAGRTMKRRLGPLASQATVVYLLCGLSWVVAGLMFPGFSSRGHIIYMLELAGLLGIAAAGQTLVVVAGGIDLSVASVMTFAAIIGPLMTRAVDLPGILPLLLILAVCAGFGLVNGLGITFLRIHPLVMTLAVATILQGVLLLLSRGTAVSVRDPVVLWLSNARPGGVSMLIVTWLVVAAVTIFLLHGTVVGRWAYAFGSNPRASELSGASRLATNLTLYGISGATAGLTGTLLAGVTRQGYIGIGDPYLLQSIAAVVIGGASILGGRGSYVGTIAGAILLVTVSSLITVINASPGIRNIALGLLVLALLILYAREARAR